MKVLHLIARMNVGGTARYLSMLSNGLEANGVESSIATGYVQGAEAEDPSVNSAKLHRIAHLGRAINPLNDYRAMQELKALVAKEKPDIIHSHTFKAGLVARIQRKSLIKAAGKELMFVHTFHGHLLDDPEFHQRHQQLAEHLKQRHGISIHQFSELVRIWEHEEEEHEEEEEEEEEEEGKLWGEDLEGMDSPNPRSDWNDRVLSPDRPGEDEGDA